MKVRILSLITILTLLTGCPAHIPYIYFGESIEAWVVDENTGKPIEGVVIVAEWELYASVLIEYKQVGQLKLMETVTDKNGRFYFPDWGPKIVVWGHLKDDIPRFVFFKNGYKWTVRPKLFKKDDYNHNWNGEIFQLSKFKGGTREYLDELFYLRNTLDNISESQNLLDCEWKKIPIMTQAVRKTHSNFPPYSEKCPSLKLQFLD